MMRTALSLVTALALAACGQANENYAREEAQGMASNAPPPPAPPMEYARSDDAGGAPDMDSKIIQQDPNQGGGQPAGQRLIAYTYNYGFKVPAGRMQGLLDAHKKLCEDAGPAKCYVVNSSISGLGANEQSYGQMTIRASADWVKAFRAGMVDGLKPYEATLDSNSDSAEDLTVNIVDSEARLRSMKTMRDRLQELLRDRPGKLSDLLEIEREFARVQGDIDAAESVLAQMKLRVAMSVLTLNYTASYTAGSESIWRPLTESFDDFMPNLVGAMAGIVRFIAWILPVVIFGGLALFGLLSLFRWRGRRRKKPAVPASPAVKTGSGSP